jgi:hypothetical protein
MMAGFTVEASPYIFYVLSALCFSFFKKYLLTKLGILEIFPEEYRELRLSGNACAKCANPAGWYLTAA